MATKYDEYDDSENSKGSCQIWLNRVDVEKKIMTVNLSWEGRLGAGSWGLVAGGWGRQAEGWKLRAGG